MNLLPLENWPRTGRARLFRKTLTSATGHRSRRCSTNSKGARAGRIRRQTGTLAARLERAFNAALDEEASRRYIAMTCHTDNADAEKAYLHFVEHVEPQLKPRQFALEQIYVAHPQFNYLPKARYQVFNRDVKNHVELFRAENVALETEEAKLCQQYQKLIGAQTVKFRGEEKTLVQMGRYLEEPDRALRQEAWDLVAKRRLQDVDKCEPSSMS
jgi:oligoendopeptidase F